MKTVISVRFSQQQQEGIQKTAEAQGTTPAGLIRAAVDQLLENATGGGLEARLAARLEALSAALPHGVADEIETRRRAALEAKAAREAKAGGR
jgi:hypothetical protein